MTFTKQFIRDASLEASSLNLTMSLIEDTECILVSGSIVFWKNDKMRREPRTDIAIAGATSGQSKGNKNSRIVCLVDRRQNVLCRSRLAGMPVKNNWVTSSLIPKDPGLVWGIGGIYHIGG